MVTIFFMEMLVLFLASFAKSYTKIPMQSSWELRNVTIAEIKEFVESLNKSMSDFTILGYKKSVVPRVMMANYSDCVREHGNDLANYYLTYENCSANFTDDFRKELVDVDNCIADQDDGLSKYYLNSDNCSVFADNYTTFEACDAKWDDQFIKKYHTEETCLANFSDALLDDLVTPTTCTANETVKTELIKILVTADQCTKNETVKDELIDRLVTKDTCTANETVKAELIKELVTYQACNATYNDNFTTDLVTKDMCIKENNETLFKEYVTYDKCNATHNKQFANDLITYGNCNSSFHGSFERDLVTVDKCVAKLGDSLKDYFLNTSSCASFVTNDTCTAAGIGTVDYCQKTHGLIYPSQCKLCPDCTPINELTCSQNGVGTESWCKDKYDIETISPDKCVDYYGKDQAFKNAVCAGMEPIHKCPPAGSGFPAAVGYTLVGTTVLFFGTTCALLAYVWKTKILVISKDKTSKSIVKKVGGEEDKWPKP